MRGRRFVALCVLAGAASAQACVKSLRWNDDAPFSMRDARGEIVGLQIDLARAALERLGCTARLVEMPWARALAELEAGRLDMLTGTFRRPEREAYAHFAGPGLRSPNVLFVRADALERWPQTRLLDLKGRGFRLGAQIGVSYGADYEELARDPAFARDLQKVGKRRALWQLLAMQRIDGVIADEATARYEIRALGLEGKLAGSRMVVSDDPSWTAFSRRSVAADFVARYEQALAEMRKDGSYRAIVERYGAGP